LTNITDTLAERGSRYGEFEDHAAIAQTLQDIIRAQAGWLRLDADMKQSLTVICDKFARILNGDPKYRDNWHDIAGYATLVDERLGRDEAAVIDEHSEVYYDRTRNVDALTTYSN
jgi:hypothetical protein